MNVISRTAAVSFLASILSLSAFAQSTEFSFQGSLKDGANPANGNYDFEFALFDALTAGTQIGTTLTQSAVAVANGVFSVKLDFGNQFPGVNRFLEIRVRVAGGGGFTTLSPRQSVASSPYSVKSLSADNAANAANAANATVAQTATTAGNALQLGGIAANQYVLTGDPRMSDARNPLPGSTSYIQNGTTTQTGNFNLSGSGTVGNTLTGNAINAATEYRLGGARVLGNTGTNNLFVGVGAGDANTTGQQNAFVGRFAGNANTTANSNSFFGTLAGRDTNTGPVNSFFGANAGLQNTSGQGNAFFGQSTGAANTTGLGNTFLGRLAGAVNTTGSFNTAVGFATDVSSANLSNATAIGARAAVGQSNSLVLGSINGVNSATADTNVGIGTTAPSERLHVVGNGLFSGNLNVNGTFTATLPAGSTSYIQNTTTQQSASNFNISGTGTANIFSAATQYNIGTNRILSNVGTDNLFAGVGAGALNTGLENTFLGAGAGAANTTGNLNTFVGMNAGNANTTANSNSFFGDFAGRATTTGADNSFFGRSTGFSNSTGFRNSFLGRFAGFSNSAGNDNTFVGITAGDTNSVGSNNTVIGGEADVLTNNLSNASAIGYRAAVGQNDSLILGSINGVNGATATVNVGIGTTAPTQRLHVVGNSLFSGDVTANIIRAETQFNIGNDRILSTTGGASNIIAGTLAGQSNSGINNAFYGSLSGFLNGGSGNSFFGKSSGEGNTTGNDNSFLGRNAGDFNTTGSNNTVLGSFADVGSGSLTNATAIGYRAVVVQSNSLVLGGIAGINGATSDTRVGIGTTTPDDLLHVNGIIRVDSLGVAGPTNLCLNAAHQIALCSSSLRYKTNIGQFGDGLSFVNKLRPITFDWKDGGMKDVGFGAEDVAKIDPRFVTYNDKGEVEGVKYDRLNVAFVNAFKEQQAQIEAQEKLLKNQQQQIDGLTRLFCTSSPQAEVCTTPEK